VITMEMFGKVRRMYTRDKKSLREIARSTGLSRNTIRKWVLETKEGDEPEYRRKEATPASSTAFHAALELALKADALRAKQYRRTAKALLWADIKKERLHRRLQPCHGLHSRVA
jgi:transposase-like protein